MEMYNWLSEKLLRGEGAESQQKMSPILEKYFSAIEARRQMEILNGTLREVSEAVSILEKKHSEEPRQVKLREDRRKEILQLYLK